MGGQKKKCSDLLWWGERVIGRRGRVAAVWLGSCLWASSLGLVRMFLLAFDSLFFHYYHRPLPRSALAIILVSISLFCPYL
jgi:hypothetical protein